MVFKNFIVPMRDKPKIFSGDIPWTRIEDIQGRYLHGSTSGRYVSEDTVKSMNLKVIPKDSIIVSVSATFGVVAIVSNDLITNQTFIGLTPKPNYNIDFLYSFFKSSITRKKMRNESAGSTIFYITRKNIENMIGNFPSNEEQDKIGKFLKSLDTIIALHQRKIHILDVMKKVLIQKILPKHLEKTPDIIFKNIESTWEESKAKNLFSPITEKNQEDLPLLSISQEEGVIYRKDIGKNIQYDQTTLKNYKVVRPDNFIISLRSFQGGFELSKITGITSPAYTVFALKDEFKHDNEFWKTYFKTYKFIESLKTVTFGIRDGKSISYSEFSSLNLIYPSKKVEQKSIGLFFKKLDQVKATHESKILKIKSLKKAYLNNMFL